MNAVGRKIAPTPGKDLAIDAQPAPASKPRRGRWSLPYWAVEPVAMGLDAAVIVLAAVLSDWYYHRFVLEVVNDSSQFVIVGTVVASLFIPFFRNSNLYLPQELLNLKSQISSLVVIWFSVIFVLAGGAFALKAGDTFSRGASISFLLLGLVGLCLTRLFWRILLAYGLSRGFVSDRRVALVADENCDESIINTLDRHGIRIARLFTIPAKDSQSSLMRQMAIERVISSIRGSDAEEIIVTADLDRFQSVSDVVSGLKQLPLPVLFMPMGPSADLLTRPNRLIGYSPAFEIQHSPQTVAQRTVKRAMDVFLASAGLLVLSLPLLIVAVLVKMDSPGPALFRQRRCGFNGREFVIFKFRTMTVQEDGTNVVQATRNDPRVTRFGRLLRRTSIDELPQLLNVLGGSMSLVGPRPHAVAHDSEYNRLVANYALRHHVKPGLTGWAQIHGFRGRTETPADMERRVRLDLWYIDNWSFLIDLKIIALTAVELVKSDKAY